MKNLYILIVSVLLISSCGSDLNQSPPLGAAANSLTDFEGVLNAAYYYQQATTTPLAVMGDFRADNMLMDEEPYPAFDRYNPDLGGGDLVGQFFGPYYTNLYKAILSCNSVIENSTNASEVGEAQFLRGLSYFKLVKVFGDVSLNLQATPSTDDDSILERQPASSVYDEVIIPDLQAAIAALDNSGLSSGRATQIAAQGMLGKVYMQRANYSDAEPQLAAVVNGAGGAGIALLDSFQNIFAAGADLNAEIIFATQQSSSIDDGYGFTLFPGWFSGGDTKSLMPLDTDLIAAFDDSPGDLRRDVTIDPDNLIGPKYGGGLEQDFIELRLGDVILLYAEALNENGNTSAALTELNKIRTRAGLDNSTATSQADVRAAIADERRLELALEGHRWFDLVRTGTVDAEMGQTINSQYHIFPIPESEVLASDQVITQNPGY
jgi:hypothetical protein